MSEESVNRWWIGGFITLGIALFSMVVGWCSWMTLSIVTHSAEIRTLSMQRDNAIPEVIEKSIAEIRQKTNAHYESNSENYQKLLEVANQNRGDIRDAQKDVQLIQKDVAYIKELLSKKAP
jgi:hypothetical protein